MNIIVLVSIIVVAAAVAIGMLTFIFCLMKMSSMASRLEEEAEASLKMVQKEIQEGMEKDKLEKEEVKND